MSRLARSGHAQVRAPDFDNESVMLKLMHPFANCISVNTKFSGAVPRRQEHRILSLGVVVLSQF